MASTNHDGPVAQLNLLHAVVLSGWSTSLDHKVAAVIISRYYPKYAGARASLRFLEEAIGSTRPNIITSIRRLVSYGAFSVKVEGKGTRPTEYALNFNFSSGIADDTSTSGTAHDTPCGIVDDTSSINSGIADDTKTYLHVPVYNTGIHESRNFSAPPSAPLSDGLKATDAGSAEGDGFDEFWKIWPRKHGLKKARAEWDKAADKAGLIIPAARSWAEHYVEHGTDKKWIAEPANWLAGERWMEDLPIIHVDARGAAITKARANAPNQASNDDKPESEIAAAEATENNVYRHIVIDDIKARSGGGYEVRLAFKDCEAGDAPSTTEVYSNEDALKLLAAVGVSIAKPNDELKSIGRPALLVIDKNDRHSFEPLFRSNENVEVTYEPLPARQVPTLPKRAPWRSAA